MPPLLFLRCPVLISPCAALPGLGRGVHGLGAVVSLAVMRLLRLQLPLPLGLAPICISPPVHAHTLPCTAAPLARSAARCWVWASTTVCCWTCGSQTWCTRSCWARSPRSRRAGARGGAGGWAGLGGGRIERTRPAPPAMACSWAPRGAPAPKAPFLRCRAGWWAACPCRPTGSPCILRGSVAL